jgi:hypothetical protein
MANTPRRVSNKASLPNSAGPYLPQPTKKFSPFTELGSSGVAIFGGRVMTRDRGPLVFGNQRWITYSDIVANTSIVAAGVRFFLNVITSTKWTVKPVDDKSSEAKQTAEFVDDVINDMATPWRRIVRRATAYRFLGFGIQEWTAKRRDKDSKIGLDDIESRPQHTIDRWDVDNKGTVQGVWQIPPQTGQPVYLPRNKLVYMVEDSLTDSPEGLGLYRHLVDPYTRLKKYLELEGRGFERDLRGIPVGRVPYQAIRSAVAAGTMTKEQGANIVNAIEQFVKIQAKSEDTSIVLDSAPYVVETESGKTISSVMQFGLELLQGQTADFAGLASAVDRLNTEMARVLGVEHLILGGNSSTGNRALSEDKSRNFYLTISGTLDDICDTAGKDVIARVCDLNGIKDELRPKLEHSDVTPRAVQEITGALRDMATAGAVLAPNDPAIDDVRDIMGIARPPVLSPTELASMYGTGGAPAGAAAAGAAGTTRPPKPQLNGGNAPVPPNPAAAPK